MAYNPDRELWRCADSTFEVIPTGRRSRDALRRRAAPGPTWPSAPAARATSAGRISPGNTARSPFVPSPILSRRPALHHQRHAEHRVGVSNGPRTGASLWRDDGRVATREGFSASPVAMGGRIFFTNDEATRSCREQPESTVRISLHVNRLGERTLASPALVDGRCRCSALRHRREVARWRPADAGARSGRRPEAQDDAGADSDAAEPEIEHRVDWLLGAGESTSTRGH